MGASKRRSIRETAASSSIHGAIRCSTATVGCVSSGNSSGSNRRSCTSAASVWGENRWVKQLRLGDVASTGPRSRALEGVAITNAPFIRPSLIGSLRYAGSLEPGWSVEAYRGGDLVAFDSANASGGFSIDLPVRYGENPVDFVAYGPFGEIREFNRT